MERYPIRNERTPARNPSTGGSHAPVFQIWNDGSITNSQVIPVLMENDFPEGPQDQYVTSKSGGDFGRDTHMRNYERNIKPSYDFYPGFVAAG